MTTMPRRDEAGFTLVELLVALVIMGIVMGSALTMMRSQSINFRRGGTRMEMVQNMRYAVSTIDRVLRTTGAGVAANQPMFVYGSNTTVLFNTNYAAQIPDGTALYINPDLPAGAISSMLNTGKLTIPGTAIQYPDSNYFWGAGTPSQAETMMFFFRPDSTTPDPNDFLLLQQVNTQAPEQVSRNIYPYPGRPFFEYWYDSSTAAGTVVSTQLAAARVPFRHTAGWHGSPGDTAGSALADSIRVVRVNFMVTNADGQDSTARLVSTMVGTPNNGLVQLKTCGDQPIFTSALIATPNLVGDPPTVRLQWNPSVDETSGETDVSQYNVYYRVTGTPTWLPFQSVAAGQPSYDITVGQGLVVGQIYDYAVAAQDCSPTESSLSISAPTIVNP